MTTPSGGAFDSRGAAASAVPNSPELMSVLLSVMDVTAVPVNPATTPQEMCEAQGVRVVALVCQGGSEVAPEMLKLCGRLPSSRRHRRQIRTRAAAFTGDPYRTEGGARRPSAGRISRRRPRRLGVRGREINQQVRVALVLHTPESAKKKVVPITRISSCSDRAPSPRRAEWWRRTCLNFMPLFHVGGICRNLLAPLLAGGSAVAIPGVRFLVDSD